jgi:hypothetical protein
MTEPEKLTQLKEMLSSGLIRNRKAGIEMAAEILANDLQPKAVRDLLTDIAKHDAMITLREAARAVLNADEARRNPPTVTSPTYAFSARCPKGHVSYYDKRVYCQKQGNVTRRSVARAGKNVDEVLLKCRTSSCNEEFFAEVDCKGYQ